jgi:hypothetical protein
MVGRTISVYCSCSIVCFRAARAGECVVWLLYNNLITLAMHTCSCHSVENKCNKRAWLISVYNVKTVSDSNTISQHNVVHFIPFNWEKATNNPRRYIFQHLFYASLWFLLKWLVCFVENMLLPEFCQSMLNLLWFIHWCVVTAQ